MKLLSDAPLDVQTKQGDALLKMALDATLVLDAIWCFQSQYRAVISTRPWGGGLVVFLGGTEEGQGDSGKDISPQGQAG